MTSLGIVRFNGHGYKVFVSVVDDTGKTVPITGDPKVIATYQKIVQDMLNLQAPLYREDRYGQVQSIHHTGVRYEKGEISHTDAKTIEQWNTFVHLLLNPPQVKTDKNMTHVTLEKIENDYTRLLPEQQMGIIDKIVSQGKAKEKIEKECLESYGFNNPPEIYQLIRLKLDLIKSMI